MKLEEGMYVRNEDGYILKLTKENIYGYKSLIGSSNIKIKSHKIKDLVGLGDFIDGMRVVAKDSDNRLYVAEDLGQPYDREFYNGCFEYTILDERYKIKTILTKEQYENNCYRIEE